MCVHSCSFAIKLGKDKATADAEQAALAKEGATPRVDNVLSKLMFLEVSARVCLCHADTPLLSLTHTLLSHIPPFTLPSHTHTPNTDSPMYLVPHPSPPMLSFLLSRFTPLPSHIHVPANTGIPHRLSLTSHTPH